MQYKKLITLAWGFLFVFCVRTTRNGLPKIFRRRGGAQNPGRFGFVGTSSRIQETFAIVGAILPTSKNLRFSVCLPRIRAGVRRRRGKMEKKRRIIIMCRRSECRRQRRRSTEREGGEKIWQAYVRTRMRIIFSFFLRRFLFSKIAYIRLYCVFSAGRRVVWNKC